MDIYPSTLPNPATPVFPRNGDAVSQLRGIIGIQDMPLTNPAPPSLAPHNRKPNNNHNPAHIPRSLTRAQPRPKRHPPPSLDHLLRDVELVVQQHVIARLQSEELGR